VGKPRTKSDQSIFNSTEPTSGAQIAGRLPNKPESATIMQAAAPLIACFQGWIFQHF
jgi:hypothetical protein